MVAIIVLQIYLSRTRTGVAIRATAQNRNAATGLVRHARRERAGTPNTALRPLAISTYYLRYTPCTWRSCTL